MWTRKDFSWPLRSGRSRTLRLVQARLTASDITHGVTRS